MSVEREKASELSPQGDAAKLLDVVESPHRERLRVSWESESIVCRPDVSVANEKR